ncbi:Cytochrome P450 monooxygenase 124 [Psilocybe cubensis]|uniref:Cytochrome P450 monooxygenase 124 n=1 Tax=Psilocybe cubensis TaxID=181762 RepID=A0ACB8GZ18_PSICU|nr:Cytochrome P450 monooxygenase 124 [Psilocybe cubensis]KAH9480259.1 Cytochrome P450 monooxygenase 124 [Psilocybe cubensis]
MPETIPILLLTFGALYTSHKLFTFWKAIGAIDHLPGYRVAFHDDSLVLILTRIPGIAPGFNYLFLDKYTTRYTKWDVTSMVSMFPNVVTSLAVADADTAKHILSDRTLFPKPLAQMKFLTFFGNNIGTVNGEEWKRHRKISAPTFSDRNNRLVWDETILIMESLFSDVWKNKDVVSVDHFVDLTLAIAIFVISVAGFGKKVSWLNDTIIPDGHKMTFKDSLHITCTDVIFKLLFPDWILDHGTRRMKNTRIAFDEMKVYMSEMIQDRRLSDKVERHDLLSALMNAHSDDLSDSYLSDSELMGSI